MTRLAMFFETYFQINGTLISDFEVQEKRNIYLFYLYKIMFYYNNKIRSVIGE